MSEPDYDAFITSPRYSEETVSVWCHNPACKNFGDEQEITSFREYGTWYWKPDECPACHGEWSETPPKEENDDDDSE